MSDDLDQLIRKAASAHLALAPARVLTTPGVADADLDHDLVARAMRRLDDAAYLAQLAPFDPEAVMMSEPDHDSDRDQAPGAATSAPSTSTPTPTGDDSGLHDIRALAQTAKHRISRKMPVVTHADENLLANTTGQLKAIALPEPARLVMLPDLPPTADAELARATALKIEARGAAATATEVTAFDQARPRKRTGLWLGAVGLVAAAAAAVIVIKSSGSSDKKEAAGAAAGSGAVAMAGPPPTALSAVPTTATPGAADQGAAMGSAAAVVATEPAPTAPAAHADEGRAAGATGGEARREHEPAKDHAGSADGADARPPRGAGAGSGSASTGTAKTNGGEKGDGGKGPGKGDKGAGAGSGSSADTRENSIDDLLGPAGGGKPVGGGDTAAKPEKKGLEGNDIKAGMAPIAGAAQACYDQHGVAGHVKVKAMVDPSGKVTKVDAIGEFAGSPTGSCVAAAVKAAAKFPAWDGPPMSINYSYTLNEQ